MSALTAARKARLELLDLMSAALAGQGREKGQEQGAVAEPQQQQEGQEVESSSSGPVHEVLQMDKDNVVGGGVGGTGYAGGLVLTHAVFRCHVVNPRHTCRVRLVPGKTSSTS
jgi:hypothetical protein